jgi:hypothetical protein
LVLMTTGGGFNLDQATPYIENAIGNLEKPLPANAAGVAQLETVVAELKQSPAAHPAAPLPAVARAISGKTFVFGPNPAQIQSIRVDFDDPAEATYYMRIENEAVIRVGGVGLDGICRPSRSGWPAIAKGVWVDDHTLLIDYNRGPGLEVTTLRMRFEDDLMLLEVAGQVNLEGRMEQMNLAGTMSN